MPEQQDQDDDRDGHSEKPEQDSAAHETLLCADVSLSGMACPHTDRTTRIADQGSAAASKGLAAPHRERTI
jgi:hypothetical protein